MSSKLLRFLLLAGLCATGGCNYFAWFAQLLPIPQNLGEPVDPEYKGLDKHSVAIVVFSDRQTHFEYPQAGEVVAYATHEEFKKSLSKVTVIDPAFVLNYQKQHWDWDVMDKTELGKTFKADYVLYISLMEFSGRAKGSINIVQGVISAEVAVYKTNAPEREARRWNGDIRVVYPDLQKAPDGVPGTNDRIVLERAVREFADQLAKKFYWHRDKPVEGGFTS